MLGGVNMVTRLLDMGMDMNEVFAAGAEYKGRTPHVVVDCLTLACYHNNRDLVYTLNCFVQ